MGGITSCAYACVWCMQVKIHYTLEGTTTVIKTISANISKLDFILLGLPGAPEDYKITSLEAYDGTKLTDLKASPPDTVYVVGVRTKWITLEFNRHSKDYCSVTVFVFLVWQSALLCQPGLAGLVLFVCAIISLPHPPNVHVLRSIHMLSLLIH